MHGKKQGIIRVVRIAMGLLCTSTIVWALKVAYEDNSIFAALSNPKLMRL